MHLGKDTYFGLDILNVFCKCILSLVFFGLFLSCVVFCSVLLTAQQTLCVHFILFSLVHSLCFLSL